MRFILFLILGTFLCPVAYAQEYPTSGIVYNTKEDSALTFQCQQSGPHKIDCDFNQTAVRREKHIEEWRATLQKAIADFKDETRRTEDFKACDEKDFVGLIGFMKGTHLPSDEEQRTAFAKIGRGRREAMIKMGNALENLCSKRDEESVIEITRLKFDEDIKTCNVSSNAFKQTFKWVSDYTSNVGAWVVESSAYGPCGIVQLDRFERVQEGEIAFWKYIAKKAITNPKGKVLLGKCEELDEAEYIYDWQQKRDDNLGCEYIKFSVF